MLRDNRMRLKISWPSRTYVTKLCFEVAKLQILPNMRWSRTYLSRTSDASKHPSSTSDIGHQHRFNLKTQGKVNNAGVTELTIRGSTFIDSAFCLNRYLENFGESFSISDTELKQFPSLDQNKHATKEQFNCSSKIKIRKAFNHDSYLGSITWFSWPRWERLLDWLALHGINAPFIPHG